MKNNELMHYGVRGQKWGRRQYQNLDGSLTSAGKAHYGVGDGTRSGNGNPQGKTRWSTGKKIAVGLGAAAGAAALGYGGHKVAKAYRALGGDSLPNVPRTFKNVMNTAGNSMLNDARTAGYAVKGVATKGYNVAAKGYNTAKGAATNAYNSARGTATNAYNTAKGAVTNAYNSARGTAANAYNTAKGAVTNAYNSARGTAANAYNSARGTATNAYNSAKGAAAKAYGTAKGAATNAYNSAKGVGSKAYSTAKNRADTVKTAYKHYSEGKAKNYILESSAGKYKAANAIVNQHRARVASAVGGTAAAVGGTIAARQAYKKRKASK